jgi:hypothetical protein
MNDPVSIISLALQAVSDRMLIFLAMSMTCGLFCWAMWRGDVIGLCVAGVFALSVFIPVLIKGDGHVREKAD